MRLQDLSPRRIPDKSAAKYTMKSIIPLLCLAILSLLSACTHTVVTLPDKTKIDRKTFMTRETLGPIAAKKTDSETSFSLGGVTKDQTDVANRALGIAEKLLGGGK